jgi:hypothetical protein
MYVIVSRIVHRYIYALYATPLLQSQLNCNSWWIHSLIKLAIFTIAFPYLFHWSPICDYDLRDFTGKTKVHRGYGSITLMENIYGTQMQLFSETSKVVYPWLFEPIKKAGAKQILCWLFCMKYWLGSYGQSYIQVRFQASLVVFSLRL